MSKQSVRFKKYLEKNKYKGLLDSVELVGHSDGITIYDVMGWKKQFDEWPIYAITTSKKLIDNEARS